jgi:hydrogenase maturation protease
MSDLARTQDENIQVREISSPDVAYPASTIVVGLGNPILGDDGIGWRVAEKVLEHLSANLEIARDVDVVCLSLGGISLMENLIGYQRAVLVDAIQLDQGPHGSVHVFQLDKLPDHACGHLSSSHDTSLQTALTLGRSMGAVLPEEIIVVGIESTCVYDFSEELTPLVAAAVPEAVKHVFELIDLGEYLYPPEE